jgi:hypothetical protein
MADLLKFIPFSKVDAVKREVSGIVTAEQPDKDLEICDYEKSKPYYQKWSDEFKKSTDGASLGNLREMHQLSAVGKALDIHFDDTDKEIEMVFKVVDDEAWKKVEERVYTGFSQGGRKVEQYQDPVNKRYQRYVANPSEISLVDNPCLPSAHFAYVKADGSIEMRKFLKVAVPEPDPRILALEEEVNLLKAANAAPVTAVIKEESLAKAKTKRVAGKDLPASSFAYVGNADDTCLTADTTIPLLDGRYVPIAELCGHDVWLYGYDTDRKCIVPALATNIRRTLVDAEILRVTLDSGEFVTCTANHPFLLRTGQYKMAGELASGDSLMPFYEAMDRKGGGKAGLYKQVYQPWFNFWEFAHHMVCREHTNVPLLKGNHVHHKDENKLNNEPQNVIQVTKQAHAAIHGNKTGPMNVGTAQKAARQTKEALNHSVISVEPFGQQDVYDLEVPRTENFAISQGIFVHNSTWKFPIHDKAHARNALARFNQAKGIPASEKGKVRSKIVAAAKKFGIEVSSESDKVKAIFSIMRKAARVYVNQNFEKISAPGLRTLDSEMGKSQRLFHLGEERLSKGMWEVSRLALTLEDLACLVFAVSCEQEWELDEESALPTMLAENVAAVTETLLAMADEECRELMEQVNARVS